MIDTLFIEGCAGGPKSQEKLMKLQLVHLIMEKENLTREQAISRINELLEQQDPAYPTSKKPPAAKAEG